MVLAIPMRAHNSPSSEALRPLRLSLGHMSNDAFFCTRLSFSFLSSLSSLSRQALVPVDRPSATVALPVGRHRSDERNTTPSYFPICQRGMLCLGPLSLESHGVSNKLSQNCRTFLIRVRHRFPSDALDFARCCLFRRHGRFNHIDATLLAF